MRQAIHVTVNGAEHGYEVEPRLLLVHFSATSWGSPAPHRL